MNLDSANPTDSSDLLELAQDKTIDKKIDNKTSARIHDASDAALAKTTAKFASDALDSLLLITSLVIGFQ